MAHGKHNREQGQEMPAAEVTQDTGEDASKPEPTAAAPAPAKPERQPLARSEAVRLMLTTLKRVDPTDRQKVLDTLATLA